MNMSNQVEFLTAGRDHPVSNALDYWIRKSTRFRGFVERYSDKIRKKCTTARSFEDLEDVRFELEIPFLFLLDERFMVEYEKYGTGRRRSPDFTATFEDSTEFNIEVKRIRESDLSRRYDKWMEELVKRIQRVPSSLAFALDMVGANGTADFLDSFYERKDEIAAFVVDTIRREDSELPFDAPSEYQIPQFDEKVVLILTKPSRKRNTDETSYHGGIEPIFYTSKEPYKLGDSVFEKLGQMIPDMTNILVCTSNSSTHERHDLIRAIRSINDLITTGTESFFVRKGFGSINDFLSKTKHLSGILFRSTWSEEAKMLSFLWCNSQATHQIPKSIRRYITQMSAI